MSGGHVAKIFHFNSLNYRAGTLRKLSRSRVQTQLGSQPGIHARVDRLASNTAMAVTIDTGDAIELHRKIRNQSVYVTHTLP